MRTSSAKAKGRRLVSKVVEMLIKQFPELEGELFQPAGSQPGTDIKLSPKANKILGPLAIECKNQEKLNIWAALKQAQANSDPFDIPIVMFSKNREAHIYAALDLSDLLVLLKVVYEESIRPES